MKEEKRKECMDQKRRETPAYKPGDLVLVTSHPLSKSAQGFCAKLAPRRDGPYQILRTHGPSSYEIASPNDLNKPLGIYHSSALRPFQTDGSSVPQPILPLRKRGRPRKIASKDHTADLNPCGSPKSTESSRGPQQGEQRGQPRGRPAILSSSPRRLRSQRGRL